MSLQKIGLGVIVCADTNEKGVVTSVGIVGVMPNVPLVVCTKAEAVKVVVDGAILHTVYEDHGKWKLGAEVHVVAGTYLTTTPNDTTKDNLGELPTCPRFGA